MKRVEYVDATSGHYIAGWSTLETVAGKGHSLYSGTVPLSTSKVNGRFVLKDPARGGSTTVDLFNKNGGKGQVFKDGDNTWGNGRASNRQTAAVDAAFGAAKTWDYYKNTFGRAGIRGNGKGAKSRVHFSKNFDNAFWDDGCFCMTYGDGGRFFKPLVALDVAGHEMSHGVTSNTAGLLYFGEPGGLNEATSDIFGTMVEFSAHDKQDPGDYWIGENVAKKATLGTPFLRRMDHPSLDTYKGQGSYDCWTPTMGADDPHFTSGVGNHFFYLLAEGTGPKTIGGRAHNGKSCNSTTFAGIGRDTAAAIWYRALTTYMTSTSGYIDARDATIRAAKDVAPTDCAAVEQTWDAVSVPAGLSSCAGGVLDEGDSVLGANPGFESGATGWSKNSTVKITKDQSYGIPHDGKWFALLNGQGQANTALLTRTQQVTVPDTDTATLRFSLLVFSRENPALEHDTFDVMVNGTPIGASGHWSNMYSNVTYRRWSVPMSAFKGQTVTIGFRGVENANRRYTGFLLDDVSLTPR
ncbi:M4 family metallopeptidase [Nocardioides ungokensis]|uniref:M4 family metallopeptidase n=1 Tax=Nocardioides ungokensis TaxID=1643322 RepID=UPI0015DE3875|nr:M4 family metallopeptidase [Nocardioides ungokensis]